MAFSNAEDQWPLKDIMRLLDLLENQVSPNDRHTFKTTQSKINWKKVAFKGYSGEQCKLKWLEISHSVRKFLTFPDLLRETREYVNKYYKSKKPKKHPDLPKKPLTAYLRFFMEKRLKYSRKHPELNNLELTKVLSKKYKKLPEHVKLKYTQDFQKEKQEFEQKLAQFWKDHPDLVHNSKKNPTKAQKKFQDNVKKVKSPSENPFSGKIKFHGEPQKPPMNEYHKFHQDLWCSRELQDLPPKERMVEIGRRWQGVPQDQRQRYRKQAEELQKQYRVDLDRWLRTLSPEEYAAYTQRTCTKRKNMNMSGGPDPKVKRTDVHRPSARTLPEGLTQQQGLGAPVAESSETTGHHSHAPRRSEGNKEDGGKAEGSSSSDSSSGDEDEDSKDSSSSSSSSGDTSDSNSNHGDKDKDKDHEDCSYSSSSSSSSSGNTSDSDSSHGDKDKDKEHEDCSCSSSSSSSSSGDTSDSDSS